MSGLKKKHHPQNLDDRLQIFITMTTGPFILV